MQVTSKFEATDPSGDPFLDELELIIRKSFRMFFGAASQIIRDESLAEDAVQDAVVVAIRRRNSYKPGTNLIAWLLTIVRFVALNHRRQRRFELPLIVPIDAAFNEITAGRRFESVQNASPFGPHITSESALGIQVALNAISETARVCFLLRTVDGKRYAEIAKILDIPEGTVMSHVCRTRRLLKTKLADAA